jgi:hypothetical protein
MEAVTLTEFLLARTAEDEQAVRGVQEGRVFDLAEECPIGCWDFDRVLAECEAKRRIIDHHHVEWAGSRGGGWFCWVCGGPDADLYERNPTETQACPDLAALASVYTSHADFDPEWRV